nr:deleted in malignant brain tumors 1 protein-like [Misgurnus anguillicaudatus]
MLYFLWLIFLYDFRNAQAESPVRLVSGVSYCSGRVEVFYNETWGTVCHDSWDISDATVVCREMGCGDVIEVKYWSYFGQGSGPIWMNNVSCNGTESSLTNCGSSGWGVAYCGHWQDAGVVCQASVRLVNGTDSCSGRVEVLHDGQWGTVCDNGWDLSDAAVVCREVGCAEAREVKIGAYFGAGSGQIWMDAAQCSGSEATLVNCNSTKWGPTQKCTHSKDAGVICNHPVRLMNGSNSCSGRVEVYHNGQWGTVCTDSWDSTDAAVACKELGCPTGAEAKTYSYFGPGVGPIWMKQVQCTGTELSIMDCTPNGWGTTDCNERNDAGVICRDVRLVNGSNQCSGRVEVVHDNQWGTVCDAGWDLKDAAVVCKHMGCGSPIAAETGAFFGQGSGPVWLDNVRCTGNESAVTNCSSKALGKSTCSHEQDAGVVCHVVNLVNGTKPCNGRVQTHYGNDWGSVCFTGWDEEDATVLCKELICGDAGEPVSYELPSVLPIWMDNVACSGNELALQSCPSGLGVSSCLNDLQAGVICWSLVKRGEVRVVFKASADININDPNIKKKLMVKMRSVVGSKGDYSVNWKTQPDGMIFHNTKEMINF